jgi:hypothetical protein
MHVSRGLLKYFDCQHYQAMMTYVEQQLPELQKLTEQKLNSIIKYPNFYQRELSVQPTNRFQGP